MQTAPLTCPAAVGIRAWSALFLAPVMACGEPLTPWPHVLSPTVTSTSPDSHATDIPVVAQVSATFSTEMASDSLSAESKSFRLLHDREDVVGTVSSDGLTVTFSPDAPLLPGTTYIASIGTEAHSAEGLPLASPHSWLFMTAPASAADLEGPLGPQVLETAPADQATGVPLNTGVYATFGARMDPSTVDNRSFVVRDAVGEIPGQVSYTGTSALFVPSVALDSDTPYTAILTAQIQDLEGRSLREEEIWTFRTTRAAGAPQVVLTDPPDQGTGIPTDTRIIALLSEAMDPETLTTDNFRVVAPGQRPVPGTVTYDRISEAVIFTPSAPLLSHAEYGVTLTRGATDAAGVALAEEQVWRFTTRLEEPMLLVDLASLEGFVAVAGTGLTTSSASGPSTLSGDVALSPTATCLGDGVPCTPLSPTVNGTLYANDPAGRAAQAQTDLIDAFIDAMGRPPGTTVSNLSDLRDVGDLTLPPGVYTSASSLRIASGQAVYLDASGDPNAVWIFQVGTSLDVGTGAQIVLLNGARASHVFWAVGASSTLHNDVTFQGSILSGIDTSLGADSVVVGRLLCGAGHLTLLSSHVTLPPL